MSEVVKRVDPDEQRGFWQRHVDACTQAGLPGIQYCKEHDLNYHRFTYWRRKLVGKARQRGASRFTQVLWPAATSGDLCVTLPNGLVIGGIGEHNVGLVRKLLESL